MPLFPNGVIKLAFPDRNIQIGDTVPDFFRKAHDGKPFKLSQQNTPVVIVCLGVLGNPYALEKLKALESGKIDLAGHTPVVITPSSPEEIKDALAGDSDLETIPYPILSDGRYSEEALSTFSTRDENNAVSYNLVFLDANKKVTRIEPSNNLIDLDDPDFIPSSLLNAEQEMIDQANAEQERERVNQPETQPPAVGSSAPMPVLFPTV